MKSIPIFLFFLAIGIASCSSSDSAGSSGVLLRKLITATNSGEYVSTYHYNGNKLDYIRMDDSEIIDYKYSGDLISEINWTDEEGQINQTTLFFYEADNLVKIVTQRPWQDFENTIEFTYNADNTANFTTIGTGWDGGMVEGNPGKYFFDDQSNIIKVEQYGPTGTTVVNYTYDNQSNPYYNITGMAKVMDYMAGPHNVLTVSGSSVMTYSYQYNSAGYPTSGSLDNGSGTQAMQYFY